MDFGYAHKDTSVTERTTPTSQFNVARFGAELEEILLSAYRREIPVSDRETLCFLSTLLRALNPRNILELGTAVGASAAVMLSACKTAHITTVEKDSNFALEAEENFKKLNISRQITLMAGDAGEVIKKLDGQFDFIFLDSAKVQYVKYLPDLKRLLASGGVLLADDVLLYGYVTGEVETPKKRRMIVEHIKEYISAVTSDKELRTTVLNLGNGLAMSVKL